ncbi:YbhB/YbcL family Raf kinase inhibitor-like protein [Terrihabitans rhizophilus]|uniref:YbhB/YbcL family Raf kinase inhibitor-like protein n=1 Tax=Terrihabitans rhizophilus TaxID=3092662 RepID=A0ABU4RJZ4_9HYPH|nr:YbhB/YbcL family Raf kinase inhibitor-like protein [Terrihabitans sp. PJ23]MDX6804528.1 YbhB/YbcL family Raf kinase inhibitor-like protein [Terrihabitans sp. PJ23]
MTRTKSLAALLAILVSSTALVAPAAAQEVGKYSNVQITGHILEPRKVEATDEKVQGLKVPQGFKVQVFARETVNPRILAVGPKGQVYASRRNVGDIIMLRDTNGDGQADETKVVVNRPNAHGLAVHEGKLYFTTIKDVYAADIKADGTLEEPRRIISDLPDAGQHPNRTIGFGPDGMLYISVGSTCNACDEANPENATMLRTKPDGTERTIFASGLRNTIGFDWSKDGKLWGMDHGIDWLGDNDQSEELNLIVEGKKYGWPFIYADQKINPQDNPPGEITLEQWASTSEEPALLYTAHAAPMQMAFYKGDMFPEEYRDDAFVAMRGSWNRKPPSGYEVVRIRFENGKPAGIEPFVTGFMSGSGDKFEHMGRLVGLAVAPDGALLFGDDENGVIYRVSHDGSAGSAAAGQTAPQSADVMQAKTASGGETQMGKQQTPADLAGKILDAAKAEKIGVTSPSFADDKMIPSRHAESGEKLSIPLAFANVPSAAKSLAVLVEDPDVKENPPFVHWIIANIPPDMKSLPEGIPGQPKLLDPEGVIQGANSFGSTGWYGMKPPAGDAPHHYHAQVFALDTMLDVAPGAGRAEFLDAMKGHVVGYGELVGTYQQRAPTEARAATKTDTKNK